MQMQQEPADEYIRRLSSFIRANEKNLAEAGLRPRRLSQRRPPSDSVSVFNPLGWFGYDAASQASSTPPKPVVLSIDSHRLFYVLMRLEALGIDIGTLDVQINSPSRPMSYINLFPDPDKSDTLSLASLRSSLSAVSGLSLGGGWWGRPEPPTVDAELKYIYSSFTKLPALLVKAPGNKVIAELANEPPNQNALPLDAFKNVQSLECVDIDPRILLGWDRLAESLRSLKIRKSGLEDVSDIFIGAVIDDQARREGSRSRKRRRRIPRGARQETSYVSIRLPGTVEEEVEEEGAAADEDAPDPHAGDGSSSPPPPVDLSSLKWAFLRHLSLSDNALTFFPADVLPYLTSLTHLDLSSNLLVSVPSGLGGLYNLVSLNLSDNMIDSVLGIYTNLGQVLYLNLAHNRLESLCGLERLAALERVDLRNNFVEETAEVGRLSILPNISAVWVEGNPLVELEEGYRVTCFDYFWKERKNILLDGSPPGFYEKRNLTVAPPEQMSSARQPSATYSTPVVAVGQSASPSLPPVDRYPTPPSSNASPHMGPVGASSATAVKGKPRRKHIKRIVEFDEEHSDSNNSRRSVSHQKELSEGSLKVPLHRPRPKTKIKKDDERRDPSPEAPPVTRKWGQMGTLASDELMDSSRVDLQVPAVLPLERASSSSTVVPLPKVNLPKSSVRARHGRYQTEYTTSTSNLGDNLLSTSPEDVVDGSKLPGPSSFMSTSLSQRPATLSSKAAKRRTRVSASVYEPPSAGEVEDSGKRDEIRDSAEAYRRKLEALKKDMGDGWLKVLSQSQVKPLSP